MVAKRPILHINVPHLGMSACSRRRAHKPAGHSLVQSVEMATCADCVAAYRGEHGPHLVTEVLVDGLRAAEWQLGPKRAPMLTYAYITLHCHDTRYHHEAVGVSWALSREGIPHSHHIASGWYAALDIETARNLAILTLRELDGEREADLEKQGDQ